LAPLLGSQRKKSRSNLSFNFCAMEITLKRFCSVLIFVSRSSQKINKSDKVLILITELNILKRLLDSPNE
jgi:hypothetical protein